MPGKGKRKGKHPQSKKSKAILRQGAAAPIGKESAAPAAQAAPAARPATPSRAAAAPATSGAARYPYFVPELKRIGILAAIIIVVLVILSIVL
jgi:hypothetical protein